MTLYSRFYRKYNTVVNFSDGPDYVLTKKLPSDARTGFIADPWITPNDMYDEADVGFRGKPGTPIPDEFDIWGDPVPKGYPVGKPTTQRPTVQRAVQAPKPPKTLPGVASSKPSFPTGRALAVGAGALGLGALSYLAWKRNQQENKKQQRGK